MGFRISEKFIVPSYWLLFIFFPAMLFGVLVVSLSLPKWLIAVAIVVLLIIGDHGLRKWASLWFRKGSE